MHWVFGVAAALALGQAPDEILDKAAVKAAEMGNYSCTVTVRMEALDLPEGIPDELDDVVVEGLEEGGGGGERPANEPLEIKVMAGAPIHLKSGEIEAYRKGDVFVAKDGETWKRAERPDARAMPVHRLMRGVPTPHEVLKVLKSSAFKEVKRENTGGSKVFSGALTEEALKALRPSGKADRPAQESTGTAKLWINGDGVVTKYEVEVETTFKNFEGAEIRVKSTKTVEIHDIGSTKHDVPAAAAKHFEAKTTEK